MKYKEFYNGVKIPMLGFGVFQIPEYEEAKQAVLSALKIGMANCYPHVLVDLCETFTIKPMINQVEMHPFFQQQVNLDIMKEYGIIPEAWAPFNEGKRDFFNNSILTEIGRKYGKTAAQTALRWNIQRGVVVIPKTVHEERMKQNFEVFDFTLSDEDMEKIKAMDIGHSEIVNHFDPQWIKMLHTFTF